MKIQRLQIKRYKSLLDLELDEIGDLTILIGKNSRGKSNIVEAINLFFSEFDSTIKREITPINDSIWYDRETEKPIEFNFTILLNDEEKEKILSNQIIKDLGFKNVGNNLTINRKIIYMEPNKGIWITTDIKLDDFFLIRGGKLEKNSYKETNKNRQAPTKPSAPPTPPLAEENIIKNIIQLVSSIIKGKFKLILATRNASGEPSVLGDRMSLIPQNIQSNIVTLQQSRKRLDEKKWAQIKDYLNNIKSISSELDIIQNKILVDEKDIRFPISYIGGGDQEVLNLIYPLTVEEGIFGIEEPELHLHPELARNFMEIFKEISSTKQLFITTHSPIFVDKGDLSNTLIVQKTRKASKIFRLKEEKDLKKILYELGHRPSDIFFADKVLLVEGYTEKVILPILAEKIGINLLEYGVSILHTRGKDKGKYHLKMWAEITKNADVTIFMLLDNNAQKEMDEIIGQKLIKQNHTHLWSKGDIEEYYPEDIFKNAAIDVIEKDYSIQLSDDDKEKIKAQPKIKTVEDILKKKKKTYDGWKVLIGRKVAEGMTDENIDEEIKRVIDRITRTFI